MVQPLQQPVVLAYIFPSCLTQVVERGGPTSQTLFVGSASLYSSGLTPAAKDSWYDLSNTCLSALLPFIRLG